MRRFQAAVSGVSFYSKGSRLLGGFYKAAGETPRPTAILLHGLPGIEKHLDIAYALRDLGWNCLYFHFRGCWGSHGAYDLAGLADDTSAATDWVVQQPEVDRQRVVLIGASTGSHPAFVCGAADRRVCGIVGISPVVEPSLFQFPDEMATEFASMLNGVTGADLLNQWEALPSLVPALAAFAPRPVLLVAAERDDIFPPSQYADAIAQLANVQLISSSDADHSFSACRPWLVKTVTEWLVNQPSSNLSV
jgi:pimeloyl-ACP methyl ester carboxylesterase